MSTIPLRVLVVDDEAPARRRVVDLLHREAGIGPIREASTGMLAAEAIREGATDLMFLDIQMPELDGLGVVKAIGVDALPITVFVTAWDQHAIAAFEANALDYLLKPFSDERFEATMERVRNRWKQRELSEFGESVRRMIHSGADITPTLSRLVVKGSGATYLLNVEDVDWIEAAGVYVTLHLKEKSILHRMSLAELEQRLDPTRFIRIHRSAIVNINEVVRLEPISHGEFHVLMRSGARVKLSRTYRAHLELCLGQAL